MRSFLQRVLNLDLLAELAQVARGQQAVILSLQSEIGMMKLIHARAVRDLIEQFLISLDHPEHEDELRERLFLGLRDLSDEVARLEEHV
jgi:hypothetical protein